MLNLMFIQVAQKIVSWYLVLYSMILLNIKIIIYFIIAVQDLLAN